MKLIELREADAKDMPFIFSSWLKSCRDDHKNLGTDAFYRLFRDDVNNIASRSQVAIACDAENPAFIFGYVVFKHISPDVLIIHYAYTKSVFRKYGVFKKLLESMVNIGEDPIVVTYRNSRTDSFKDRYKFIYKPDLKGI